MPPLAKKVKIEVGGLEEADDKDSLEDEEKVELQPRRFYSTEQRRIDIDLCACPSCAALLRQVRSAPIGMSLGPATTMQVEKGRARDSN